MTPTPQNMAALTVADLPPELQTYLRVTNATQATDIAGAISDDFASTQRRIAQLLEAVTLLRPLAIAGVTVAGSPTSWVAALGPNPHATLMDQLGPDADDYTAACRTAAGNAALAPTLVTTTFLMSLLTRYANPIEVPTPSA